MYTAALEFLEDERDAWRPYEALAELTDAQLEAPDRRSTAPGMAGAAGRSSATWSGGWSTC